MGRTVILAKDVIFHIYRASWLEMPEVGDVVGVIVRTPHGEAEIVGEVISILHRIHRFSVKISEKDALLLSSFRDLEVGVQRTIELQKTFAIVANSFVLDVSTRGELQ